MIRFSSERFCKYKNCKYCLDRCFSKLKMHTLECLDVTPTQVSTTYDCDPNVMTSEFNDPKTFRPSDIKSQNWADCPSNQNCDTTTTKSRCGGTVEHYNPLEFLVSIVCDITTLISPTSLAFSSQMLGSGRYFNYFALLKSSCVPRKYNFWGP